MGIGSEIIASVSAGQMQEIFYMVQVKMGAGKIRYKFPQPLRELVDLESREFCYAALNKVSRSFAYVIQILPEDLRDVVCVFYLVLRALDTVEDDMTLENSTKLPLLLDFHKKLDLKEWSVDKIGLKDDEIVLLENFTHVLALYHSLPKIYREVIQDITKKMGKGMHDFTDKVVVTTLEEWDLYCHYVAGLVGHGLSALFSASGHESQDLKDQLKLSNSMGLFLQKTNIIRDYHEDLVDQRTFWPEEIWKIYASSLDWFAKNPKSEKSRQCLNHLICNAMSHAIDSLEYMSSLKNPNIFRFCGIPQVMAMATMDLIYDNEDVFRKTIKIRKGLTAKIMMTTDSVVIFKEYFHHFAASIEQKVLRNPQLSSCDRKLLEIIGELKSKCQTKSTGSMSSYFWVWIFFGVFVAYSLFS